MFTKKTKIVAGTAVLTMLAFAVTGVASARVGVSRLASSASSESAVPMHDDDGSHADHEPHRGRGHLDAAASALGVTTEALKQSLKDGSTLADVAASQGVDVQKVIDAVAADEKAEIAQAVTDGKLTQAQADAMLARVVEHATAIVNRERPPHRPGVGRGDGHGPRGRHDRFGHRDHGPSAGDGPTADQSSDG